MEKYPSDKEVRHLLDTYDWYLIPVVNPDGYIYSWSDGGKVGGGGGGGEKVGGGGRIEGEIGGKEEGWGKGRDDWVKGEERCKLIVERNLKDGGILVNWNHGGRD